MFEVNSFRIRGEPAANMCPFYLSRAPILVRCVTRYVGTIVGASSEFTAVCDESATCLIELVEVTAA